MATETHKISRRRSDAIIKSGRKNDKKGHNVASILSLFSPYDPAVYFSSEILEACQKNKKLVSKPIGNFALESTKASRASEYYSAHSYHTKVPPEAIVEFIEKFCPPQGLILDPFCGSGMTGIAARITGRNAILNDLSVAATHLTFNHTADCDILELKSAYEAIRRRLEPARVALYTYLSGQDHKEDIRYSIWGKTFLCVTCSSINNVASGLDMNTGKLQDPVPCSGCGAKHRIRDLTFEGLVPFSVITKETQSQVISEPAAYLLQIDKISRNLGKGVWFPKEQLDSSSEMFIRCALKKHNILSVRDYYTPRNFATLGLFWDEICKVKNARVRSALAFAFTNTSWHATKMRRYNARGGHRPLTGTLYFPPVFSEANPFLLMDKKVSDLINFYRRLGDKAQKTKIMVSLASAAKKNASIPESSIDYVFTDPPFGSNIFYSDLNFLWESWLGRLTDAKEEAVLNKSKKCKEGGKNLEDYATLMDRSFEEIERVLKPEGWKTLVFHNTDPKVWRALQRGILRSGMTIRDASVLNRAQQSVKGYKGRASKEKVAHFDVILSCQKLPISKDKRQSRVPAASLKPITPQMKCSMVNKFFKKHSSDSVSAQKLHSFMLVEAILAHRDLGCISFEDALYAIETRTGQINLPLKEKKKG